MGNRLRLTSPPSHLHAQPYVTSLRREHRRCSVKHERGDLRGDEPVLPMSHVALTLEYYPGIRQEIDGMH